MDKYIPYCYGMWGSKWHLIQVTFSYFHLSGFYVHCKSNGRPSFQNVFEMKVVGFTSEDLVADIILEVTSKEVYSTNW